MRFTCQAYSSVSNAATMPPLSALRFTMFSFFQVMEHLKMPLGHICLPAECAPNEDILSYNSFKSCLELCSAGDNIMGSMF